MRWSKQVAAAAAFVVFLVAAGTAGAAHLGASTPPDMTKLVLTPFDVPGSTSVYTGELKVQGDSFYVSLLSRSNGASAVLTEVELTDDAQLAAAVVDALRSKTRTAAGRAWLSKEFAQSVAAFAASADVRKKLHLKGKAKVTKVIAGTASSPSSGVLVMPFTVKVGTSAIRVAMAYVQVDRGLASVELMQAGGTVTAGAMAPLIKALRGHLVAGFTVTNTMTPSVAGTVAPGQMLSADSGNWIGGASDFTYTWLRCGADGGGCTAIGGAAGSTYAVTPADAGTTIRVTVKGANTVSSAEATSSQTAVVVTS
jgi:hypothetical protein